MTNDIKDRLRRYDISHVDVHRAADRIEELERERNTAEAALSRRTMERDDLRGHIEKLEALLSTIAKFCKTYIASGEEIAAAIRGEAAYEKENET